MRELDGQDLSDLLYGAAILGTGGGGELAEGFDLIDQAMAAGKRFILADLAEAPPDALIATPYLLGAISDLPAVEAALYEGLPQAAIHPILMAFDRMVEHLGNPIAGCVPCELGGSNSAVAFFVAAMRDGVVYDADPAGRAVPEITHSTYFLAGLPAAPVALANAFGETFLIEHIQDDRRSEALVRALATISRHDIAAVDHVLPANVLSPAILHGTLSNTLALGALWRRARHEPDSLPDMLAEAAGGFVAFRGRVSHAEHQTVGGFTIGQFTLSGSGDHEGSEYRITLKNENMAGWHNGKLHATIPDMICVFDTETGAPVTNPHTQPGQAVAVLILPAPAAFCTAAGLAAFGPSYIGLASDYAPARPLRA
ncbi:MAG: DUF917 domain-containing protein [Pseudomonadota bacterium]